MQLHTPNAVLIAMLGCLFLASGTHHERAVISADRADAVRALEASYSERHDASALQQLAQAYVDAESPGLAVSAIGGAPVDLRATPVVQHTYARALLDSGRAQDALVAEHRALDACASAAETGSPCETWLVASATRRADILAQLAILGVQDAQAHPEASAIAYHNATREARFAVR
jgi:hypothetical protein